jgi:hypothetical protein
MRRTVVLFDRVSNASTTPRSNDLRPSQQEQRAGDHHHHQPDGIPEAVRILQIVQPAEIDAEQPCQKRNRTKDRRSDGKNVEVAAHHLRKSSRCLLLQQARSLLNLLEIVAKRR